MVQNLSDLSECEEKVDVHHVIKEVCDARSARSHPVCKASTSFFMQYRKCKVKSLSEFTVSE